MTGIKPSIEKRLIDGIAVNPKITTELVMAACERRRASCDDPGFCLACGLEVLGIEPDASGYECESCGEPAVYGCEDLLMEIAP